MKMRRSNEDNLNKRYVSLVNLLGFITLLPLSQSISLLVHSDVNRATPHHSDIDRAKLRGLSSRHDDDNIEHPYPLDTHITETRHF